MFCSLIFSEDRELSRRFGDEFDHYKEEVPALLPKFANWKKFIKYIFVTQK